MKNIILSLMIISSLGCQTTSPSTQEQETQIQAEADSENQDSNTIVQSSNPDEITFKIEVLEDFSSGKEICGVSKKNVFTIKVLAVIEKGVGISHTPNPTNEILVNFLFLTEAFEVGTILEARAKESLCLDASKSYFSVISHKILE